MCLENNISRQRLPAWLRKQAPKTGTLHDMKRRLRGRFLHTVCEEARCPNVGECFARGTAAILIMGDVCTRRCGFCAVHHGAPGPLDPEEPVRVAQQICELSLAHAVITSVTRDDLPDGGANQFATTIREVRRQSPQTTIEVLTPDFDGRAGDVATVCEAHPDVFNHNIETVERLAPTVRNRADYRRSLGVLSAARRLLPKGLIKSGLMVGLGETGTEVEETLADLNAAGCDIVTIGQYLPPSRKALPVVEYVAPEGFLEYEAMGKRCGIPAVFSGPLVRSSYHADVIARSEATKQSPEIT